jgi:hypothetical protein
VPTQNFASKLSNLSPEPPPSTHSTAIRPQEFPVKVCNAVDDASPRKLELRNILTCSCFADGFRQEARPYRQEAYVCLAMPLPPFDHAHMAQQASPWPDENDEAMDLDRS